MAQIKLLQPEEIQTELHSYFNFDKQFLLKLKGNPHLRIERVCKNCQRTFDSAVSSIRSTLRRNRGLKGFCRVCNHTAGSHLRGHRSPTAIDGFEDTHGYVLVYKPDHPFGIISWHTSHSCNRFSPACDHFGTLSYPESTSVILLVYSYTRKSRRDYWWFLSHYRLRIAHC